MAKEYLIQGDTLTNIADKIRVLSGTEGDMGLDDMATHIGDANASIDAALSAIADKGVQIPEGANIGSIVDLIGDIEVSSGIQLPELTNEGIEDDLVSGKELIDSSGNIVIGTNPYEKAATDAEVDTQADLIAQIMSVLDSKTGYNTIYVGSSVPTDDFGVNGDIYVVRGEG